MNKLIALVGFKSSGKSTVAQYLVNNHNYNTIAFADPLKDCISTIFGWDREMLEGLTPESRLWREEVDPWWAEKLDIPHFTPRFCMQNIGTDVMRKTFHDQVWILNMERRLLNNRDAHFVVSDVRFANEIRLIRKFGGTIYRVKRGADPSWMNVAKEANEGNQLAKQRLDEVFKVHQSEWAWIGEDIDGQIDNDGDIETLYSKLSTVFNTQNSIPVNQSISC